MITVGDKTWNKLEDIEKISYCDRLFEDAKSNISKPHFEWYLNYMFIEGNHYSYYNTATNTIEKPPRKRGEVRIVVNKVRSSIRAIKNYSTRFQPKWEIVPGDIDEDTIKNARRSGKFLDYLYRTLHLETVVKGVVDSALNTSVGWVELDWDANAEKGLGQVRVRLHDSFDVFIDPNSYVYGGKVVGRYMMKAVKKPLDEIKTDNKYDKKARENVKQDNDDAAAPMKARIIRKEGGSSNEETIKRATVKEFYLWDDEKNEEGGNIWLFTYAGKEVLRNEPLNNTEFPLYLMQIPQDPLKVYHRSWTADAVPLNKALDRAVSQKIMYVNQALLFRIIAEKGHGVNTISNENGELIEVNPNRKFEQWNMQALPSTLDSLTGELGGYIEDVLGAHEAAMGQMPVGARSGKVLEALQAADANNLVDIRESLESFLSIIGKRILEIVEEKYQASRIAKITEPEEGNNYIRVVGGGAKNEVKRKDATVITGDNEVIVKIGSWLGHTQEAQRESILKLAEIGAIDAKEVLKQFEFPNVEELSERAREQRMEQHTLDAEIAGRNQGGGGQAGPGGDLVGLADKENMAMMNGEQLPPTEGADMQHTQAHRDFINTKMFQSADPAIQQVVQEHAQGEMQSQGM